jgi:uncharacterized membrane protein YphA (DoxX/SURF4 family)
MDTTETHTISKRTNITLWILQGLSAALFVFAGAMKFVMPIEEMTKQIPFPGWFLHFIGVAEVLGGLGLILPGLFKVGLALTPLAAAGLVVIMIGATVVSFSTSGFVGALLPFVVGLICAFIAVRRAQALRAAHRYGVSALNP